jgi:UDP:flavonoid glycosyltransferase YjiC (YdhE family)
MGFWPSWFGKPDEAWLLRVEPVGFVRDESVETGPLPSCIEDELQGDAAPILITHATSRPKDRAFFEASIRACGLLGRKVILVTSDMDLLEGAPTDLVQTFEYLPFADLMPRMAAVIHHGGIGTSGQALNSGVPQLVLPLGYDRGDNAVRLKQLGVADFLLQPDWQPNAIAETLSRLMASVEINARCQELAHKSKAGDSVSAACAYIESLN